MRSQPLFGIGRGLEQIGEVAAHIQNTYDASEAKRIAGEASEDIKGAIELNSLQINDPDEFNTQSNAQLSEIQNRVNSIESPRIKQLALSVLADNFKAAQRAIEVGTFKKKYDKVKANFGDEETRLIGEAASPNPEIAQNAVAAYGTALAGMVNAGMGYEEARKRRDNFFNETMNLEARQNPIKFINDEIQGKYTGRDSTAVRNALEIAQRVETNRAEKDKREMDAISKEAERTYEQLAAERRLDVEDLKRAARFYGWSDDKVNGLIKMQIGLKAANPYETASIEDAMSPVDKSVRPGMTDIRQAERNLANLAKGGQVSTSTPEYRAAMRRLQSMYDRLDVRGDIELRQGMFDARQAIADLYKEFYPGNTSKGLVAERSRQLREVTALRSPQEQRRYVDNLQAQFERQRAGSRDPEITRGKLRSVRP